MLPPNEPIGNSSIASWCRKLLRWCKSLEIQPGAGYAVRKSSGGAVLEIFAKGGAATPTESSGPTRYRVKTVMGDYLICRTWDGTTEGSTDVYVAKPPALRHSLVSQSIDGATVTFTYQTRTGNLDGQRTASSSGETDQIEIVVPVYANNTTPQAEIWAEEPIGGTGVSFVTDPPGISQDSADISTDARAAETAGADASPTTTIVTLLDKNEDGRAWCHVPEDEA